MLIKELQNEIEKIKKISIKKINRICNIIAEVGM